MKKFILVFLSLSALCLGNNAFAQGKYGHGQDSINCVTNLSFYDEYFKAKSYEDALAKMGVEEIKALGEKFDPEKHYAVFHVEDDKYGENEIIEVIGKGYIRGGKVIRYSFVKVAN